MFVRWQSGKGRAGKVHLRAILVEAARVGGRPTQRHIAYLGGIAGSKIGDLGTRCSFWKAVLERLNRLNNRVSEDERQKIIVTIAAKVEGPPTQEQYVEVERERDRRLNEWAAKIGMAFLGLNKCKFCGKKEDEVNVLVRINASAICNECLDQANELVRNWQSTSAADARSAGP
jgi:hypothetical protein